MVRGKDLTRQSESVSLPGLARAGLLGAVIGFVLVTVGVWVVVAIAGGGSGSAGAGLLVGGFGGIGFGGMIGATAYAAAHPDE